MKNIKQKYAHYIATILSLAFTTLLLSSIRPQITYAADFGPHLSPHPEIYTEDYIFYTDTFEDPFYEGIFLSSIENEVNRFYMPRVDELSDNAFWCLFNTLFYKYFPESFFHGYDIMKNSNNFDLIYVTYRLENGKRHFYYNITDEAYRLMKDDTLDNEYDDYINSVIQNAGINLATSSEMNQEEIVGKLVRYLSTASTYNADKYFEVMDAGDTAHWMLNRDYKIAVCASDSRILKSCLDKLGIPCNMVGYPGHLYNQVCVNGKWRGVDITGFRRYGYFYDNFNDWEWNKEYGINIIYQ